MYLQKSGWNGLPARCGWQPAGRIIFRGNVSLWSPFVSLVLFYGKSVFIRVHPWLNPSEFVSGQHYTLFCSCYPPILSVILERAFTGVTRHWLLVGASRLVAPKRGKGGRDVRSILHDLFSILALRGVRTFASFCVVSPRCSNKRTNTMLRVLATAGINCDFTF